jgi:hypothetical protein
MHPSAICCANSTGDGLACARAALKTLRGTEKEKEDSQRPQPHRNPSSNLRPPIDLQPPQDKYRHNSHDDIRRSRNATEDIHRDHISFLTGTDTSLHTRIPLAFHWLALERDPQDKRYCQARDDCGRRAQKPGYGAEGAAEAQQEGDHGEFGEAEGEEVHYLCDEEGAAPEGEVLGWGCEGGDVFAAAVGGLDGDHDCEDCEGGLLVVSRVSHLMCSICGVVW